MRLTQEGCVRATSLVIGMAVVLGSLQVLAIRRHLVPGGFWDWAVVGSRRPWMHEGLSGRLLSSAFASPVFLLLVGAETAAGALLVAGAWPRARAAWLFVILAVHLLTRVRLQSGIDGADQMAVVVLAGLLAYSTAPTAWARTAALSFVAAEAVLCYTAAGAAKLLGADWRGGTAVVAVLATREFGLTSARRALEHWRGLAVAACWVTIAFELSAPLAVLLGPRACLAFITVALAFHVAVAVVMGLDSFVWSFAAAYPAMLYVSTRLAA